MKKVGLQEYILNKFFFSPKQIFVAVDPDSLLFDEQLLNHLKTHHFQIVRYGNPVEFRYLYERDFHQEKQKTLESKLLVIFPEQKSEIKKLPFDILSEAEVVTLSLGDVFPRLNYDVLQLLGAQYYEKLFSLEYKIKHSSFGKRSSIDFILHHIFEINLDMIQDEKDLVLCLIKLHYEYEALPEDFVERLVFNIIQQTPKFKQLPLMELFSDTDYFMAVLQTGWEIYISGLENKDYKITKKVQWIFGIENFEAYEIQALIEKYFAEDLLNPLKSELVIKEKTGWYLVGLLGENQYQSHKVNALIRKINSTFQELGAINYTQWLRIAELWADLKYYLIRYPALRSNEFDALEIKLLDHFENWIENNFDTLLSLPPITPTIVHQIPHFLSRELDGAKKVALIVMDGMSLWQWRVLVDCLQGRTPKLTFSQQAVFAWIPTITSISRQAIFVGNPPVYFANSIFTTNKEEMFWKNFWKDQGYKDSQVQYFRNIEGKEIFPQILPNNRVLGVVINAIDDIMHGMKLGEEGMYNQIQQWGKQEYFSDLLNRLLEEDYQVWITSDHGNIQTNNRISISDGVLASAAGERVRIYNHAENVITEKHVKSWVSSGLPDNLFPVLAERGFSFSKKTGKVISHGGSSIEEVVVPFIKVGKTND